MLPIRWRVVVKLFMIKPSWTMLYAFSPPYLIILQLWLKNQWICMSWRLKDYIVPWKHMNIGCLKEPKNTWLSILYRLKHPRRMVVQSGRKNKTKKEGSHQDKSKKNDQLESSSRNNSDHQDQKGNKPINKKNTQSYNCQRFKHF